MSYSSRIHLELPQREGVAALPYAEVHNPMGAYFAEASVRADTAVRPYAEDLDRVASFWSVDPFCVQLANRIQLLQINQNYLLV